MHKITDYDERLKSLFPDLEVMEPFINCTTKILHKCIKCNNVFYKRPDSLLHNKALISKGQGCPFCNDKDRKSSLNKTNNQYLKDILDVNNNWAPLEPYINAHTEILHECKICGNKVKIKPFNLEQHHVKCSFCNSIWNSPYKNYFIDFLTEEQMKAYSPNSGNKIIVKCPDCGREKEVTLNQLKNFGLRCSCSDNISYPNKFIYKFLELLGIEFISEYHPLWANNKRYDIFIPSLNCIIENHGKQHYEDASNYFGITLEKQQIIDKMKKDLALQNNIINYIELDCSFSSINFLSNSILNNKELNNIINIPKNFNWEECDIFASKNLIKETALLWEKGLTVQDIYRKLNISQSTVTNFLKKAQQLGLCNYTKKEAYERRDQALIKTSRDKKLPIIQKVAELWNSPEKYNITDISNLLNLSWDIIHKSILIASDLGLCTYTKNRKSKFLQIAQDNRKKELNTKIADLWNNNYSISEIIKEIKMSSTSINNIIKELSSQGIIQYSTKEARSRGKKGTKKNIEWTKELISLWDQGYGTKEIEKRTPLSYNAMYARLKHAAEIGLCSFNKKENYKRNNSYIHNGLNNPSAKKVKCIETGKIYRSAGEASRALKITSSSGICSVCNGKQKKAHGLQWEWVDQD